MPPRTTFQTPAPVATAPELHAPLDIVFINGFRGDTVIGIHPDELHVPQPLRIDLAIGVPRPLACDTDRISDTVDYSEVRDALRGLLGSHRCQLLEAFAESIASLLIKDFGAHWVRVGVTKPAKFDDVDGVGVIIERRRPGGAPARPRDAEVLSLLGAGMLPGSSAR